MIGEKKLKKKVKERVTDNFVNHITWKNNALSLFLTTYYLPILETRRLYVFEEWSGQQTLA